MLTNPILASLRLTFHLIAMWTDSPEEQSVTKEGSGVLRHLMAVDNKELLGLRNFILSLIFCEHVCVERISQDVPTYKWIC